MRILRFIAIILLSSLLATLGFFIMIPVVLADMWEQSKDKLGKEES